MSANGNDVARERMLAASLASQAVSRAVRSHPTAVRWERLDEDKGHPFSLGMHIRVLDDADALVFYGIAEGFAGP